MQISQISGFAWPEFGLDRALWLEDGQSLLIGGKQQPCQIDAATGEVLQTLEAHPQQSPLRALALSPDQRLLAGGSHDGWGILIWNLASGRIQTRLPTHALTMGLSFDPDGQSLMAASGHESGFASGVHRWDLATGRRVGEFRSQIEDFGFYHRVCFSQDGSRFATAGGSCGQYYAQIWDRATDSCLQELPLATEVKYMRFAPGSNDSLQVATDDADVLLGYVLLSTWTDLSGQPSETRVEFKGHGRSTINCVALNPDATLIASGAGSEDSDAARIWNPFTCQQVAMVPGKGALDIHFSPQGERLAVLDRQSVRIFELRA
ncbi:MAG: WD40 repeat domain-containing protein [Beijerinckiaceae bacterium]